jgi:putative MATE family efflux protein
MEKASEDTIQREGRSHSPKGPRSSRDWTKGSILRNLWELSWPMMITQTVTTLGPVIDMVWVGKLGSASIAGVGISAMVVQLMNATRQGLQVGTRATVSRSIGAHDEAGANNAAQQTLVVTVVFALIIALIGIFLSRQILMLMGLQPDVVDEGVAYLRIQLIGMMTMSFQMMTQSIMQASGDSVRPMWISIGAKLFHIAICPFLIFGWWIFPRMGVGGAGLAGVLDGGVAAILGMWLLYGGRTRLKLTLRNFRFDGPMIWRIIKIGIPATLNGTERNMSTLLVTWFVVPFGTLAVAAHALMQRIDQLVHMPATGLGQGAGVLAGQNLGAKQPDRAEKTGWLAAGLFTGVMTFLSILILIWPQYVIRLFNSEPDLVALGSAFLRIQTLSYFFFGYAQVLQQCINGVGDTVVPLIITMTSMWVIQMPGAFILPRVTNLGVYGVRWAVSFSIAVRAGLYAAYFKLGRWKRRQV